MVVTTRALMLVLLTFVPAAASATPLTWTFTSDLIGDPGGAAAGSTTADVILVFDSLTPDLNPSASVGEYAVQSARIEFENGHVSTMSDPGSLSIDVGLGIRWTVASPLLTDFGIQGGGGFPATDVLLTTGVGPVIANAVSFVTTDDLTLFFAFATNLTIVPEPALTGLLGIVLLGICWRDR